MEQKNTYSEKSPGLFLIDAIEMQHGTEVIFKARGRSGVPHKILRVGQPFHCIQSSFSSTKDAVYLNAGDYVAAYRTPQTTSVSGAYYIVRLGKPQLEIIDRILKRRFNTSLDKECRSNRLTSLKDLSSFSVGEKVYGIITSRSTEKYEAYEGNSTGLHSIIQLNGALKFWTKVDSSTQEGRFYYAKKGDYFAVRIEKKENGNIIHLHPLSKDDVPSIKMQDKRERILHRYEVKKRGNRKTAKDLLLISTFYRQLLSRKISRRLEKARAN